MIDYTIVTLQLALLLSLPGIAALVGFLLVVAWYYGLYRVSGYLLRIYEEFKESIKLWRDENNTSPTI